MRVYFVPSQYFSGSTPRLIHVADSSISVLDQYTGDPSSAVIQDTEHQLVPLYRSVGEKEKCQFLGPLMTS